MSRAETTVTDDEVLGLGQSLENRRRGLWWLVLALMGALGIGFVVLAAYGTGDINYDYWESLLLIGLLALLTCAVAYFADKEREHRRKNQELIQELHSTARALDSRVARLNKLCETSTRLAGTLDVDRISELVVEALVGQVEADAASLVLLDKDGSPCVHQKCRGTLVGGDGQDGDGAQVDEASGQALDNVLPSDPEFITKLISEEGQPGMAPAKIPPELTKRLAAWGKTLSTIYAPMKVSRLVGGALSAARQGEFSGEDLNLLTTLANMAAKAIESAELHEELRQSYFRTLHVLMRSLAARDSYSAAHGEAVTALAVKIAERMGLKPALLEALRAYGPLHDVGKIGISDAVLLKPGPLTEEELSMCRQHPLIGEEIIRPLNPPREVLSMIRNHHERWDGLGYPDGLEGEKIPLLARVLAVADAFHAMTSHRPYRPATILYGAIQEIKVLSGEQFDPKAVKALVELWESGDVARLNMRSGEIKPAEIVISAPPPLSPPSDGEEASPFCCPLSLGASSGNLSAPGER